MNESEYEVKVADFGLAVKIPENGSKWKDICGTPSYIGPELFRGEGHNEKWDIFSLGSVMYNLITGGFLFNA